MNTPIPNLPARPPDPEHLRLKALFDELRKNQLTFLNEAGKRVIELSTGMLAVLYAVVAFGDDFPPPYLENNLSAQIMAVITLVFFFLALVAGFLCVQPQEYRAAPTSIRDMQSVLEKAMKWKALFFRIGSIFFVLGALMLASLIILIIV